MTVKRFIMVVDMVPLPLRPPVTTAARELQESELKESVAKGK